MLLFVVPLYLVVIAILFAGTARLAASLRGQKDLAWKHAFIFGVVAVPLFHVGSLIRLGSWLLPLIFLWLLPSLWGAWYFRMHVRLPSGEALSFREGFIRSLISVGMIFSVFLLLGIVLAVIDGPAVSGGG
jgi:hypothetical protein